MPHGSPLSLQTQDPTKQQLWQAKFLLEVDGKIPGCTWYHFCELRLEIYAKTCCFMNRTLPNMSMVAAQHPSAIPLLANMCVCENTMGSMLALGNRHNWFRHCSHAMCVWKLKSYGWDSKSSVWDRYIVAMSYGWDVKSSVWDINRR